jgi:hypothetical protein
MGDLTPEERAQKLFAELMGRNDPNPPPMGDPAVFEQFATEKFAAEIRAAVAAEREECIADIYKWMFDTGKAQKLVAAIRARGDGDG